MVLMNGASIDAVNTQQFRFIFTIKSDEIIVFETFLRHLVLE